MRKFLVILKGGNVALEFRNWFRRRRGKFGFYTTRLVVAEDEHSAVALATTLVRAELNESGTSAFDGDTITVGRDKVEELASFGDADVPGRGFTFFPEDP